MTPTATILIPTFNNADFLIPCVESIIQTKALDGLCKLIVINKITWQAAAIGTPVISGFQYAFLPNAGAQVGTASPVLTGAYSNVTGVTNLLLGSGNASICKFLGVAATMTTAPTVFAAAVPASG